jgi:hypothetical protein
MCNFIGKNCTTGKFPVIEKNLDEFTNPDYPRPPSPVTQPVRFHGTVTQDPMRAGAAAGTVAEEVIAHLAALVGAKVAVTLEIEAELPAGFPDAVVRTVTENSRTLKFTSSGFEKE